MERARAPDQRKRKNLRDSEPPSDSMLTRRMLKDVYVADNLTRYNSAVMFAARELKREGRINSSWTDSGKMKVRIGGRDSPTKIIRSAADLRKLVGDHAALDAADALLRSQQIAGRDRPLDGAPGAARAPERGTTEPGTDRPSGAGAVADPEGDTSNSDCETPSSANQQRHRG